MADQDSVTRIVNEAPHSVELSVNAKGKVHASVKVYDNDIKAAADAALETLRYIKSQLGADAAGE